MKSVKPICFYTILHPLVDACSVTVLVVGGMAWQRVLAYNALAFALQLPLGGVLDVRPQLVKGSFVASLALTLAGVGLCACGGETGVHSLLLENVALVLACVGNALFHLSAGKTVLDTHEGKGGPIGLFISTGALGLFAGMKLAGGYGFWCCLGFGAALAAVGTAAALWINSDSSEASPTFRRIRRVSVVSDEIGVGNGRRIGRLILFGLFALVAWRSWAGLLAGGMTNAAGLGFALAGAAVTWAGKAACGYIGDSFGRWTVTAVSVAGSLSLCFLCRPEQAALWLALLFVAQLATGPVLSLMYDKSGRAGGTAFGLNCLALFTGSL